MQVSSPSNGSSRGGHIEETSAMGREACLDDVERALERRKVCRTLYCRASIHYVRYLRLGGRTERECILPFY
jgi:hypothetical protein